MTQYLFYQHNVQKFFRDHRDKYSGIIVPLSIAVSFPTGTYGFVRALCARDATKRYAIDPRTPLFQCDWDRSKNIRDPHRRVAEILGEPFASIGLSRALTPGDFANEETVQSVTARCLSFQKEFRLREETTRKIKKYMDMLMLETLGPLGAPQFLVPPYFRFRTVGDDWYEVNRRCTEISIAQSDGIDVRPVLHFAECGGIGEIPRICDSLNELNMHEVTLYPNDFKEHQASDKELAHYRRLSAEFRSAGVAPHAMHGGYFAMCLSKFGLASFANGIGYGEWRNSGYHAGGTAAVRVYVLKLHRYISGDEAQTLVDEDPEYFAEDTELFAEYRAAGKKLGAVTLAEALNHFMECRQIEQAKVIASSARELAKELAETVAALERIGPLVREKYGDSLARWQAALEAH